jgi:hypothetical protein
MSLGHGASVVRNNTIIHWDPANLKSYSGTGTTVTDLSGTGKNGTLINGLSISNGVFSNPDDRTKALRIQSQDWSSYTNFTVDVWYKRTGVNNWGTGGSGQPSYYQGIFNYYWQGSHSIFAGTTLNASSNNLTVFTINTTLELNMWVHIVGITGPGGRQAFINGVSIGTAAGAAIDPNKDVYFGNWDTSWASFCEIGAIKVYSKALTQTEVTQNFNALRGRYGI